MKKGISKRTLMITILGLAILVSPQNAEAVKKPVMPKEITIHAEDQKTIKVKNATKKVKWKSSNKTKLEVQGKGKYKAVLSAKKEGTVNVKATTSGISLNCKVKIKEKRLDNWNKGITVDYGYNKAASKKYVDIKWNRNSSADGYYIYRATQPEEGIEVEHIELVKKIKGNKITSYRDLKYQNVKSFSTPSYYVSAYKKTKNGKKICCDSYGQSVVEKTEKSCRVEGDILMGSYNSMEWDSNETNSVKTRKIQSAEALKVAIQECGKSSKLAECLKKYEKLDFTTKSLIAVEYEVFLEEVLAIEALETKFSDAGKLIGEIKVTTKKKEISPECSVPAVMTNVDFVMILDKQDADMIDFCSVIRNYTE